MTAASILREARQLITDPDSFTADGIALDDQGREVSPDSSKAVAFCVVGALLRINPETNDLGKAAVVLRKQTGPMGMFTFEETYGHAAVLAIMDRAAQDAEVGEAA